MAEEKVPSNIFDEEDEQFDINNIAGKSVRRASTHSKSPVRFANLQSTGWTKKKSLAMISDDKQKVEGNQSVFQDIEKGKEELHMNNLNSDTMAARKMTKSLDKTFQERLKKSSQSNSFILFGTMGIQMFYLSVLLITQVFQNQTYTIGVIALFISFFLAIVSVQVARFIEFKFKSALISLYLYVAVFLVIIILSPNSNSPMILLLGFVMMTTNCLQSSEIRLTYHILLIFGLVVSAYLIKSDVLKTDCFGHGYCPSFQQPDIAFQLFWVAMCIVGLFIVLHIDQEVHINYQEFKNAEDGVHTLVSANLDLQNQLRVAKIKPETDIAAPLTRATQLLVSFQEKNKNSENDGVVHDIEQILSILNSDKLFEPEFFQDTGDTDVTNFLQDVLQTKKTVQLKSISGPVKTILKPNQMKRVQSELITYLDHITDPFCNIIELEVLSEGHALYYTAVALFKHHDFQQILNIPERSFCQWILKIELGYDRKNPYHNSSHAADVTQVMNFFISRPKLSELLTSEETLSCLIAAIGHDYMHPGFTNAFLVATRNPLALRYNDSSVLEHFHAASVCELFGQSEFDLFSKLSSEQKKYIREMIITMIMATDMSFHFEWLSKFKNKLSTNSFNFENLNDKKLILNIAMKCADINNLTRPLEISRIWTQLVIEEFFLQGDQEKARGIPVSMFMDRNNTDIPKCQIGFIDYIVLPLYESWANFLPSELDEHIANLKSNKAFWKGKSEQGQPIEKVNIPKFNVSVLRVRNSSRISASLPNSIPYSRKVSGGSPSTNPLPESPVRASTITKLLRRLSVSTKPTKPTQQETESTSEAKPSNDSLGSVLSDEVLPETEESIPRTTTRRKSISVPDLNVKIENPPTSQVSRSNSVNGQPKKDTSFDGFNTYSSFEQNRSQTSDIVVESTISEAEELNL